RRALCDVRRRDLLGRDRPRRLWPDREGAEGRDRVARGEPDARPAVRDRLQGGPAPDRSRRAAARGRGGGLAGRFLEGERVAADLLGGTRERASAISRRFNIYP